MKKIFFGILAVVAMVATSCQQEVDLGVNGSDTTTVTFEIGTPQVRSYSDGTKANLLKYVVYTGHDDATLLGEISETNGVAFDGNDKLTLELAVNKHYTILFWAQNENANYYTLNAETKTITVNYANANCNDDNCDAFYGVLSHTVTGATTLGVELKRPFAQVNIGASDFENARKAGLVPTESKLVVKNVCNTLNLLSGVADGSVEATFNSAAIGTEAFPVDGFDYLAMSYVLVGKDESVHDVAYTITAEDGTVIERTIGAVPTRANYRTNIYGKLLTSTTDINIEIKPEYEGENNKEVNINTTDYYIAATYEAKSTHLNLYLLKNITDASNQLVGIDYGDGTFGEDGWHTYSAAGDYKVKFYFEKPVTEIHPSAFSSTAIKSIVIPNSVTRIGSMAFNNSELASISLERESKLTTIEQGAFVYCRNLKSIHLPSSVTEIGDCAFGGCYSLESIGGGARSFSTALGVFYKWLDYVDCHVIAYPASSDIEIVNYAPNHHNIGWGAFVGCKYLKQLDIIINKIYQVNFWDCEQLEYIRLEETTYIENDVIKNCPKLKDINLPLASKIGENCFINNESLTTIFLGCNELKVINKLGYNNVSLNTLSIPSGVESITYSFNSCAALENIYCKATTPPALANSFDAIPATAKIYVPYLSYSKYKVAEGWNQYADKIVAYDFENNTIVDLSNLQVGDLFEINNVKGVVFQVGDVVKMVSVEQGEDLPWSTAEWTTTGAKDADNGANNMATIKEISGWEYCYLAFKWCADYGKGWYLPAENELVEIYNHRDAINLTLEQWGYKVLNLYGNNDYWSSTETNNVMSRVIDFRYEPSSDNITGGGCWWNETKNETHPVRSVIAF